MPTGTLSRTAAYRRRQQRRNGIVATCLAAVACVAVLAAVAHYAGRHQPPPLPVAHTVSPMPLRADPGRRSTTPPATAAPSAPAQLSAPTPTRQPPPVIAPPVAPATTDLSQETVGPLRDDPAARHLPGDYRCLSGWFELPTSMPDVPRIRCDWRIPVGSDGRPLPTAADIVAVFPYPTEKSAVEGFAAPLAARYGFTILSLRFTGMRPEDGVPATDRTRWYYYPESGAGEAWLAAIARVRELGGLPDRPIFATGRSGGGSAAHLFAEAYPERVAAVVQEADRVHADRPRHPGPMLLLHGHHDYVAPACIALEGRLRNAGSEVLRVGFPPAWQSRGGNLIWQHGANTHTADFMWRWLAEVADLRLEHGRIPPMATWPTLHGGQRLPGTASLAAIERITPDREVLSSPGARLAIARPAPATAPRTLVIQAINRFETDAADTDLDCLNLADRGHLALAASADGEPVLSALQTALRRPDLAHAGSLPWILAVDAPDGVNGLIGLRRDPPRTLVLFNASERAARTAAAACSAASVPLVIAGTQRELGTLRSQLGDRAATWAVLRDGNRLQHHADRAKALLAAADRVR